MTQRKAVTLLNNPNCARLNMHGDGLICRDLFERIPIFQVAHSFVTGLDKMGLVQLMQGDKKKKIHKCSG